MVFDVLWPSRRIYRKAASPPPFFSLPTFAEDPKPLKRQGFRRFWWSPLFAVVKHNPDLMGIVMGITMARQIISLNAIKVKNARPTVKAQSLFDGGGLRTRGHC